VTSKNSTYTKSTHSKGTQKMQNKDEAKLAWILWQVISDLNQLLWDLYEDHFLDFIMEERDNKIDEQNLDT